MILTIRLKRCGRIRKPFYIIIVTDNKRGRNALAYENLGSYDPFKNNLKEKFIKVNLNRLNYWLSKGAIIKQSVLKILLK